MKSNFCEANFVLALYKEGLKEPGITIDFKNFLNYVLDCVEHNKKVEISDEQLQEFYKNEKNAFVLITINHAMGFSYANLSKTEVSKA